MQGSGLAAHCDRHIEDGSRQLLTVKRFELIEGELQRCRLVSGDILKKVTGGFHE